MQDVPVGGALQAPVVGEPQLHVAARPTDGAGAKAALDRLERKDFAGTLLRFVDRLRAAPRREHPPVAFDFWAQVTEAEEMDELRPFRPAAFQALPKSSETSAS